jgi:mannitol/fructose-specific phosphotransferase system IIA component (Ntr-type)
VRATGTDPEALNTAAVNALRQLVTGDGSNADEARQQAAQALAQARKIPPDQAREQVAKIEQQYHQTVGLCVLMNHRRKGNLMPNS